jgi:hypothetical protein
VHNAAAGERRGGYFHLRRRLEGTFDFDLTLTEPPTLATITPPPPQESDVQWASRWDVYLRMPRDDIHWFSIFNSTVVLLFLSAMVAVIMIRILKRDVSRSPPPLSRVFCANSFLRSCLFRAPIFFGFTL